MAGVLAVTQASLYYSKGILVALVNARNFGSMMHPPTSEITNAEIAAPLIWQRIASISKVERSG